jgi:beta-glucanase (GH16 family)
MEQLNKDTFVYHTMHTEYIKVLGHKTDPDYYTTASYNPHEFNVFGMEWTPDKIDMFINDSLTFSYPRIKEEGSVQWPFDVPFFLLLNQILGGWAGEIDDAELPVQMEVDWVRYYELPENMR